MSVARRSNGAWIVKFKDETGQWRQRQFKEEAAARRFDAAARQMEDVNEELSLRDVVTAYCRAVKLCQHVVSSYSRLVNGGVRCEGAAQHLADRYVSSLTRADLESVRERMRAAGNCDASINLRVGQLQASLSWAASEDLIEKNPWGKYRPIPGVRHRHRVADMDQLRAVYQHLPEWMQWAVRTAMALCLRPGLKELFALQWSAFDWRTGVVRVYMSKVNAAKTVYAPDAYMTEARERYNADPKQVYVCPGPTGQQVVTETVYRTRWDTACRRSGVRIPFYGIRHAAASEMLAGGADLAAVAAQLGHRDITTTGVFYTHAVARAQRHAAATNPLPSLVAFGGENTTKSK